MSGLQHEAIAALFESCFWNCYQTRCLGGAVEPCYEPVGQDGCAKLYYRGDYAASALHEISHWSLAGAARRQRPDFGYAYIDAPRALTDQVRFLRYEVRAQALESLFADAAGVVFRCSYDDVEDRFVALRPGFAAAVVSARQSLLAQGLPARAQQFVQALQQERQRASTTVARLGRR